MGKQEDNYRKKYKEYYGIEFDETFDIHHIDFNHDNNDIDNLILLPKKLHSDYHKCLNDLKCDEKGFAKLYVKIDMNHGLTHDIDTMAEFCRVMSEIQTWKNRKMQLDLQKQVQ